MRAEVCQLHLPPLGLCLFPFQPSWRLLLWLQREIGISKNKAPPALISLNINREVTSTNAHSLVPSSAKGNLGLMLQKGNTLSVWRILTPPLHWAHCSPFHPLFSLKSDKTTQKVFSVRLFLLVVEQSCDGTALMRSY